jgi:hypothetical protein
MAASVKLEENYKRKLDRLRENLSLMEGGAVSLQETLQRAIDVCLHSPDLMLAGRGPIHYPLPPEAVRAIHAMAQDWGVETSEEDIDKTLYGGRRRRRS